MPLVSVIMPCYNHAEYISQSIESVLSQSLSDFEVIVIDDCSMDGSRNIVGDYACKDSRIKPIFNRRNEGPGFSRNAGMKMSKGEVIAFCDADDAWEREKLGLQLDVLAKHLEYDVVHSDATIMDSTGKPTGERFSDLFQRRRKLTGDIYREICLTNFINTQTVIMRKCCLGSAGYFPENCRVAEDWVYWVKISRFHKFFYVDRPLAKYRIHRASTNRDCKNYTENRIKAINHILNFCPKLERKVISKLLYHLAMQYYEIGDLSQARAALVNSWKNNIANTKSLLRLFFPPKHC